MIAQPLLQRLNKVQRVLMARVDVGDGPVPGDGVDDFDGRGVEVVMDGARQFGILRRIGAQPLPGAIRRRVVLQITDEIKNGHSGLMRAVARSHTSGIPPLRNKAWH